MTDTANDPTIADRPAGQVFTLAHWGKRALARLIDYSILVVIGLVFWLVSAAFGFHTFSGDDVTSPMLYLLYAIVVGYSAAQVYFQGTRGKTVGKRAVGIEVVRAKDANRIGVPLAFGRAVLKWFALVGTVTWFLNNLWPLWDKRRQTVVDKLVDVVVIDTSERV